MARCDPEISKTLRKTKHDVKEYVATFPPEQRDQVLQVVEKMAQRVADYPSLVGREHVSVTKSDQLPGIPMDVDPLAGQSASTVRNRDLPHEFLAERDEAVNIIRTLSKHPLLRRIEPAAHVRVSGLLLPKSLHPLWAPNHW